MSIPHEKVFPFNPLRPTILTRAYLAFRWKLFHETGKTFTVSSANGKKGKGREMVGDRLRGSRKKDRGNPLNENSMVGIHVV